MYYTKGSNSEVLLRMMVWSSYLIVIFAEIQMPPLSEVQAGQPFSFPIESDSEDPESRIVCKFSSDGINYKHLYNSEFDEVSNGGSNLSDRLKVEKQSSKKVKMRFTRVTTADEGWYFCVESSDGDSFKSMHLVVSDNSENTQPVDTRVSNSTAATQSPKFNRNEAHGVSNATWIAIGLVLTTIIIIIIIVTVVALRIIMVKRSKKKGLVHETKKTDEDNQFLEEPGLSN